MMDRRCRRDDHEYHAFPGPIRRSILAVRTRAPTGGPRLGATPTPSAGPRADPSGAPSIRRASAATALVFGSRLFRSLGRVLVLVAVARAFSVAEVAAVAC